MTFPGVSFLEVSLTDLVDLQQFQRVRCFTRHAGTVKTYTWNSLVLLRFKLYWSFSACSQMWQCFHFLTRIYQRQRTLYMVENVRFRHCLLFQLYYAARWMRNLQLFLSYSEDNASFHNIFINSKNMTHSAWTRFLKPECLNSIGQLPLFLLRPCLPLCRFILMLFSFLCRELWVLTDRNWWRGKSKGKLTLNYLCYQTYIFCFPKKKKKKRNGTHLDTVTMFLFKVIIRCREEGRLFYIC